MYKIHERCCTCANAGVERIDHGVTLYVTAVLTSRSSLAYSSFSKNGSANSMPARPIIFFCRYIEIIDAIAVQQVVVVVTVTVIDK
jgi:hypothetical protein